jgi:toxin YoeB
MKNVAFTSQAFKEYNEWFENNLEIIDRIKTLIREIDKEPFKGIGKPEPLKGNWSGYWSRRIDHEHRLVYKVTNDQILIIKCKGHY